MKTFIVDSFTAEPFRGNPCGVCLCPSTLQETRMLQIANELGFSETAFVVHESANRFGIRYFTPSQEVPLCGHATLGAAAVLFRGHGTEAHQALEFVTASGVTLRVRDQAGSLAMQFPTFSLQPEAAPAPLVTALGLEGSVQASCYEPENNILMLEIESVVTLAGLAPQRVELLKAHDGINGVVVTTINDEPTVLQNLGVDASVDFCSRFFWPWAGTLEDPVTGATHTFMAPYWAERLGKHDLTAYQLSRRGGLLRIKLLEKGQVELVGDACIVLAGEWLA